MLLTLLYIVGFLRTLIILVVIYLIVRWLRMSFMSPSNSGNKTNQTNNNRKREGETTIRFNRKGKKMVTKEEGEYVDFEEVD